MSNERERLAREWATSTLPKGDAKTLAAIEHIMATTTEPRMEEVEWEDEKHFLAGAVYEVEGSTCPVVMVGETRDGCEIYSVDLDEHTGFWPMHGDLTPNGKKYELVEVTDEPEHPETLCTVEDYENAPEGTVVSSPGAVPAMKNRDGRWRAVGITTPLTSGSLALGAESPATVLRWGWGE